MDLRSYQEKAITTNKWLGDHQLIQQFKDAKATISIHEAPIVASKMDTIHMIIGMASELNELQDAIQNMDSVNIAEELGDIMWYAANEATITGIPIVAQTDLGSYSIQNIVHAISSYADLVKKNVIYNKEIDAVKRAELLQKVVTICYNFNAYNGTFGATVNLPHALTNNIDKLMKKRYKNGYSDEAANNRDVAAERTELEK